MSETSTNKTLVLFFNSDFTKRIAELSKSNNVIPEGAALGVMTSNDVDIRLPVEGMFKIVTGKFNFSVYQEVIVVINAAGTDRLAVTLLHLAELYRLSKAGRGVFDFRVCRVSGSEPPLWFK